MITTSAEPLGLQRSIETKKITPRLNPKAFTGEEDIDAEGGAALNGDPLQELIDSCKIDLSEELAPPPIAMEIMSDGRLVTLFTKGNFSIVTGAAKSRKTFLLSMLTAASVGGRFQDFFFCPTKGINIVFDTEQSRYKAQQVAQRVCNLSETINPENLEVYSLRTLDPSQRLDLIETVLARTPNINFVAIDGIIDLGIDPILQSEQAQRIISKLMVWSEVHNIHIVCVLHYNKTVATLLGHLGSFSNRKADAIIEVAKCKEDDNISLVKAIDCREKDFSPFAFSINQGGMPFIMKDYVFEKKGKEKKEAGTPKVKGIFPSHIEDAVHANILACVFNTQKEHGYNDLWRNIKNACAIITGEALGDNKAKDFVTYYLSNESIIKVDVPKKKPIYTLSGQVGIDF